MNRLNEMTDEMAIAHDLDRRFADFKISKRARTLVRNDFGSLSAVAVEVQKRQIIARDSSVGGFYTMGGIRDAVEFRWFKPRESRETACGQITALEIAKALLILGAVSFEDCFPEQREIELKNRVRFNEELKALGWPGPFLDGPKRAGRNPTETKAIKLRHRIKRLKAELAKAEVELGAT